MDLSALRTLEYAIDMDVGTVQSPAVNVTMPGQKAGTPVPAAESKPLAPMGTCIGANGLDSAAGTGVPAFCPGIVTFTAGLCTVPTSMSMAYLQKGLVMLRDPCLFLRNSHSPRETFGGINMDLSALRTLESAKYGGIRHGCRSVKPGCKRQCRGKGGRRFPQQNPSR